MMIDYAAPRLTTDTRSRVPLVMTGALWAEWTPGKLPN